jgi:hypothetical protein
MRALPNRYATWVRPQDPDEMSSMVDGEWQKLVDVLIANLAMTQSPATPGPRGASLRVLFDALETVALD